ncbi:hypothetical protein [Nocardia sp. NPDC052566]
MTVVVVGAGGGRLVPLEQAEIPSATTARPTAAETRVLSIGIGQSS